MTTVQTSDGRAASLKRLHKGPAQNNFFKFMKTSPAGGSPMNCTAQAISASSRAAEAAASDSYAGKQKQILCPKPSMHSASSRPAQWAAFRIWRRTPHFEAIAIN